VARMRSPPDRVQPPGRIQVGFGRHCSGPLKGKPCVKIPITGKWLWQCLNHFLTSRSTLCALELSLFCLVWLRLAAERPEAKGQRMLDARRYASMVALVRADRTHTRRRTMAEILASASVRADRTQIRRRTTAEILVSASVRAGRTQIRRRTTAEILVSASVRADDRDFSTTTTVRPVDEDAQLRV
jgi:hypothetical protein